MDLLRQSSESLAGKISYIEMTGLNVLEIGASQNAIQNLWLRGGSPIACLVLLTTIHYYLILFSAKAGKALLLKTFILSCPVLQRHIFIAPL